MLGCLKVQGVIPAPLRVKLWLGPDRGFFLVKDAFSATFDGHLNKPLNFSLAAEKLGIGPCCPLWIHIDPDVPLLTLTYPY